MRLFFFLFISAAWGCTDFALQSKDGSIFNGRSLEFSLNLESKIELFPRNERIGSLAPNKKKGLQWVSQYGYLGITPLGMNFSFEGLNEAGLGFGYLWLPGFTEYPEVPEEETKYALDFVDFGAWVLGNFSSIPQLKQALKEIRIWGHPVPGLGDAPVHAAIHDAQGNHLVVEFIGKVMKVYDNPIAVLTNSPPFEWQMSNLHNYLNLNAESPPPALFHGISLSPLGQGAGFLGLPGDWMPSSRFVKIATYLRFVKQPEDRNEGLNLTEHLLNTVDIPLGTIRDPGKKTGDYTQWIVIKDLTQKIFYFRSYEDPALKRIDLKQLNFNRKRKKSVSIDIKKGVFDVTDLYQSE